MPARQNWFDGWRLFALLSLTLLALSVWIAGMRGFEVDGVRMVIRFTARTSLVLFCLAFSAAALARLWSNAWTRWLRRNRRYLGVSFAASHAIHAVAILAFAVMDPAAYAAGTSIESVRVSLTVKIVPVRAFSGRPPSEGGLKRGSRHVPVHAGSGSIFASARVSL